MWFNNHAFQTSGQYRRRMRRIRFDVCSDSWILHGSCSAIGSTHIVSLFWCHDLWHLAVIVPLLKRGHILWVEKLFVSLHLWMAARRSRLSEVDRLTVRCCIIAMVNHRLFDRQAGDRLIVTIKVLEELLIVASPSVIEQLLRLELLIAHI